MSMRNLEITMSGWVANEPKLYYGGLAHSPKPFCMFSLIHTPLFRDTDGEWKRGEKLAVNVKVNGDSAHYVHESVNVGQPLLVRGILSMGQWVDKEGVSHKKLQLNALSLGQDLMWGEASFTRKRYPKATADRASFLPEDTEQTATSDSIPVLAEGQANEIEAEALAV